MDMDDFIGSLPDDDSLIIRVGKEQEWVEIQQWIRDHNPDHEIVIRTLKSLMYQLNLGFDIGMSPMSIILDGQERSEREYDLSIYERKRSGDTIVELIAVLSDVWIHGDDLFKETSDE